MVTVLVSLAGARAWAEPPGMRVSLAIEGSHPIWAKHDCAHEIDELGGSLDPEAPLRIEIQLGERENRLRVTSLTRGTIVDDARPVEASVGELCRNAMRLALAATWQEARSLRRRGEVETRAGWVHLGLGAAALVAAAVLITDDQYGGAGVLLFFGGSGILVGIPLLIAGGVHKHQPRAMTVGISPMLEGGRSAGGSTT
jgi:hypothetical protein